MRSILEQVQDEYGSENIGLAEEINIPEDKGFEDNKVRINSLDEWNRIAAETAMKLNEKTEVIKTRAGWKSEITMIARNTVAPGYNLPDVIQNHRGIIIGSESMKQSRPDLYKLSEQLEEMTWESLVNESPLTKDEEDVQDAINELGNKNKIKESGE